MAHFAELESKTDPTGFTTDTHLVVKRVVVVGNDVSTAAGPLGENDEHVDGETWCVNFFDGGTWKQTSYNHNFRKQYAGKGMVYNASKNKFLLKQPYASWSLDGSDDWQAPVTYPNVSSYDHPSETYSQEDVDANVYPVGHAKAGQRLGTFNVGDPKEYPYYITWDEDNLRWIATDQEDPIGNHRWDADNTQWVSV
jgi:hypothetical protein